jgi:ketosteroid isomerase-like protein
MFSTRGSTAAWLGLTVSAGLVGFTLGRSPQPAHAAASSAVLLEADRAFDREVSARGIEGWVDFFADDSRMFPDSRNIVEGKTGIRGLMSPLFSNPDFRLRWQPLGGDIAACGDLGYTFGHSTSRRRNAAGEMGDYFGKYVTIWKKQPDGGWKAVLDIGNSRPRPE